MRGQEYPRSLDKFVHPARRRPFLDEPLETMVSGSLHIANSLALNEEQKEILFRKLANRINADGLLQLKSQIHRSQLANKEEVVKKMTDLISQALIKKKPRLATKPSKAAKQKRLESKKKDAVHSLHDEGMDERTSISFRT